jgi:hypothetical protein
LASEDFIASSDRELIRAIIEYTETLPEPYRERVFGFLIGRHPSRSATIGDPGIASSKTQELSEFRWPVTPALRGFFARTGLSQQAIGQIAMDDNGNLEYFRFPSIKPKSRATIDWALLLSLQRGIMEGDFSVTKAELREKCKEQHCYDQANFSAILRDAARYFSGPFIDDATRRRITPDGERELVSLIERLGA